jgi:hypothetical protein
MLRRIFGSKTDVTMGGWSKLHVEIKGHVARIEEKRNIGF